MIAYCVGHKAPIFMPCAKFVFVGPEQSGSTEEFSTFIVPDDSLGDEFHGRILSEYTQLFALAEHQKHSDYRDHFYIFQYRKFLSLRVGGEISENMPYVRVIRDKEAQAIFPSHVDLNQLCDRFLVGPLLRCRSIADQYASVHYVEDFILFVSALGKLKIFSEGEINNFVKCEFLFPAPSLGVTKIKFFIEDMEILKNAWLSFHRHFYCERDGYQRRTGGFLLERLHSYLVLRRLASEVESNWLQGNQYVVSDTRVVQRTN